MILFDYGHTLCYEPNWDSVRGNKALLPYITKNPYNKTLEDIVAGVSLIYGKHLESIRANGYDISGQVGDRVLYEYLGIEFSLTPLEQEIVFWRAASEGAIMPNADKMLDHLHKLGIRTIGDLAAADEELLVQKMGKRGRQVRVYARGEDEEPVKWEKKIEDLKSVGNSMTLPKDVTERDEIKRWIYALSESVAGRLRDADVGRANTVHIVVRNERLEDVTCQTKVAPRRFAAI